MLGRLFTEDVGELSGVERRALRDNPLTAQNSFTIDPAVPAQAMPHALVSKTKAKAEPTRQDLKLIYRAHRKDFERFGYDPPSLDGKRTDLLAPLRSLFAFFAGPAVAILYDRGRL